MQTRHLDSEHLVFTPQLGERAPGFKPKHFKVLILPDQVSDTTEGGIALPDEFTEKADLAQTEGELIDFGDRAFEDWNLPPEVGDRIVFSRHSGQKLKGDDGFEYRVILDNDILGVRK